VKKINNGTDKDAKRVKVGIIMREKRKNGVGEERFGGASGAGELRGGGREIITEKADALFYDHTIRRR